MPTTVNIERRSFVIDKSDRIEHEGKGKYSREIDNSDIIEARLMVIGNRGVGKTALIRQLLKNNNDENRSLSKEISTFESKTEKGESADIYYTDFTISLCEYSDKDIYNGTFKINFTRRSIYLLVLDAGRGDELDDLHYWLNTIKLYSNDSPVIIVLNKIDVRVKEIDEQLLLEKFDNIAAFHRVSAKTGSGISNLVESIKEEIIKFHPINKKLPKIWKEIRGKIKNLNKDYISYEEYSKICSEFRVDERGPY